jgi:hypothetical protein
MAGPVGLLHGHGSIAHIDNLKPSLLAEQRLRDRRASQFRQSAPLGDQQLLGHRQPAAETAGIIGPECRFPDG